MPESPENDDYFVAVNPENSKQEGNVSPSYWKLASQSMHAATETTYTQLASMIASLYQDNREPSIATTHSSPHIISPSSDRDDVFRPNPSQRHRKGRRASAPALTQLTENPYNLVRGRHSQRTSRSAVQSLLSLVPVVDKEERTLMSRTRSNLDPLPEDSEISPQNVDDDHTITEYSERFGKDDSRQNLVSDSETASQLAEGTIRALRDLCLDEAGDLHASLQFWTHRWERPLLGWLEAGPSVWTSETGYNHQNVGRKVSQIQAVLARRCYAIGELQEHLLKAGWQSGVAQWGALGWAAVAGFDGAMASSSKAGTSSKSKERRSHVSGKIPPPSPMCRRFSSDIPVEYEPPPPHETSGSLEHTSAARLMANVLVQNQDGGGIFVEDPSNLAEWSVQAIELVRRNLYRAANGKMNMPYLENWVTDQHHDEGPLMMSGPEERSSRNLPRWATEVQVPAASFDSTGTAGTDEESAIRAVAPQTAICDLPLMAEEVCELVDVMEEVMDIQRSRRLDRLKPPSWFRRNWYIVATVVPTSVLFVTEIVRKGEIKSLLQAAVHSISSFVKERLRDPVVAIGKELLKGRENFSDSKARAEATEVLRKMIYSWLSENYPKMPEKERRSMAQAMDVSLVEKTKEESMKTFYEINNVIRMSFIEMQYMKKEMMNALGAMDEMMSANDINMNLAAITPVFLVAYVSTRFFRFLFYVFLKVGKSREEVYASFSEILTDIDRLLVMRDSPPLLAGLGKTEDTRPCVLGRDDLGMLMLLIHECRTIMWRAGPGRFSASVVASVSEDLAELAGERGPVSVRQQLQIVARMSRTYSFLRMPERMSGFRYSHLRNV